MSKIVKCELCKEDVLLNGIGSSRNKLQRVLTATLQFIIPLTTRKFLPASDWHDMAVHRGPQSNTVFEDWYVETDRIFYHRCLSLAEESNWFGRMYYKKQAEELYDALRFNDGNGYPLKPCKQRV